MPTTWLTMPVLANHTLLELHGCLESVIRDSAAVERVMLEAVRSGGGTIVTQVFHNFSPHGVSGVIVIAESHVAVHTWPEHGYAAVDIFSCSPSLDHRRLQELISTALGAGRVEGRSFVRG